MCVCGGGQLSSAHTLSTAFIYSCVMCQQTGKSHCSSEYLQPLVSACDWGQMHYNAWLIVCVSVCDCMQQIINII